MKTEEWKLSVDSEGDIRTSWGLLFPLVGVWAPGNISGNRGSLEQAMVNRDRLVACWNFCHGYETDTLRDGPDLKEILGWAVTVETGRILQHALEQIIDDRFVRRGEKDDPVEECWCYDEQDGAPDSKPGRCLPCRIRSLLTKLEGS